MNKQYLIVFLILWSWFGSTSFAEEPNSKLQSKIDTLREITAAEMGLEEAPEIITAQIFALMAQANPSITPDIRKMIKMEVKDVFEKRIFATNKMAEISYRLYQKHLSETEMDLIIETYRSPGGKLIQEKLPLIMADMTKSLEQEIAELSQEIQQRILANLMKKK